MNTKIGKKIFSILTATLLALILMLGTVQPVHAEEVTCTVTSDADSGDGTLRAADLASGLLGAVVKDPVQDRVGWQEYLETVVKERSRWTDLYRACRKSL